jgi:hypothetical protein
MMDSLRTQVALFTGQSDRRCWALSPLQSRFLAAVAPAPCARIDVNFPYRDGSPAYRAVPLVSASFNNAWLYMRSRSGAFRVDCRASVAELIDRRARTIFLAGSCGLELFNNLALPSELMHKVSIFAFGPVARRRPSCEHVLVGSTRDRLSRHCFPAPDHMVDCGHMGYLADPAVHGLCRLFIGDRIEGGERRKPPG